jgi:hypothetical protein
MIPLLKDQRFLKAASLLYAVVPRQPGKDDPEISGVPGRKVMAAISFLPTVF